jgi:tRNA A37 methylthiotransferase MiaB
VFKFFHIPVQSGSNKVLRIMGRRYAIEEYKELHAKVKAKYPSSLFATDIIVGHPGESEEDFMETVNLVRELRFERVHLAQYSIRPHTRAAAMRQVPDPVKKRRSKTLSRIVEEIGREIYGSYVGRIVRVLLTSESYRGNAITGRMDNYFPVIIQDGLDRVQEKWVNVRIVSSSFFDLRGEPVG